MKAALMAVAVGLTGCTVYQQPPYVVEHTTVYPSAYWTVVHEQTQADLSRRASWETEEQLRRQQWTDAEIRHNQVEDLARYAWAVRRAP